MSSIKVHCTCGSCPLDAPWWDEVWVKCSCGKDHNYVDCALDQSAAAAQARDIGSGAPLTPQVVKDVLAGFEAAAHAEARAEQADAAGAGSKHDAGKLPVGLIPREALLSEAAVLAFGAKKYAAHNWRQGMRWSRLGDAAMRHLLAWLDGEDNDPETGLPHLAHLRCCAGFLLSYSARGEGTDDRHKFGPAA